MQRYLSKVQSIFTDKKKLVFHAFYANKHKKGATDLTVNCSKQR